MKATGRSASVWARARAATAALLLSACAIDSPTSSSSAARSVAVAAAIVSADDCLDCIFGVETFVRTAGAPNDVTLGFNALASSGYVAQLDPLDDAGVNGEVTLNGQTLLSLGRGPNDKGGRREVPVTLGAANTLAVRLVGRPGSGLRVAIRALTPVKLDELTLAPATSVELEGTGMAFNVTVGNYTKWLRNNIGVRVWVVQGAAIRASGGQAVSCGAGVGELPPGRCVLLAGVFPSNSNAGSGTLVPGSASARVELIEFGPGSPAVLESRVIPITLLPPPPPSVLQVSVAPPAYVPRFGPFAFLGAGSVTQFVANVQTIGNAPQSVTWASSATNVATVSSTGQVTAVSTGDVGIGATSTWDVTKSGTVSVHVYTLVMRSPSNGTNVSTGATTPPTNALSVLLKAEACGPTAIFPAPFERLDFIVFRPGRSPVVIGSVAPGQATLTDDGAERCWGYAFTWTPGATLGPGPVPITAVGYYGGGLGAARTADGFSINLTDP